MVRNYCFALILLSACAQVHADAVGGKVGLNLWGQSFQPSTRNGGDPIDLDANFDLDDEVDFHGYIAIEHPLPLIPNFMLQHSAIETDGVGLEPGVVFDDSNFAGEVDSKLELSHTDLTAYYEVLDNWVNLDLGLTIRSFDAGVTLAATTGDTGDLNLDDVVPMVYGMARFDLPFTGWYLQTDGNYYTWDGDEIIDVKAGLGWDFFAGFGIEAGYRYLDMDYSGGGGEVLAEVQGPYAGLFWDF